MVHDLEQEVREAVNSGHPLSKTVLANQLNNIKNKLQLWNHVNQGRDFLFAVVRDLEAQNALLTDKLAAICYDVYLSDEKGRWWSATDWQDWAKKETIKQNERKPD